MADLRKLKLDTETITNLEQYNGRPIDIILGNNVLGNMKQQMVTLSSGRMVTNTILGVIIYPPTDKAALIPTHSVKPVVVSDYAEHVVVHTIDTPDYYLPPNESKNKYKDPYNVSNQKLAKQVEQLWSLELLGIEPPEVVSNKAKLNAELIDKFKKSSIRDESNKIFVAFPFNGREEGLEDNFAVAMKRLKSLWTTQSPETMKKYVDIVKQQLLSEIIEKVEKPMQPLGPVFYIPHHCVVTSYEFTGTQLVLFSDASQDHYAAVAYLRFTYPDKTFVTKMIYSKSRVKPGRVGITIPQLELLALQAASNVAVNLLDELHIPIEKVYFFSDSTCVLYWVLHKISNHLGLKWAANRVKIIHNNLSKLTEKKLSPEVRYVPTKLNPADLATRGCSVDELIDNKIWHEGPPFLTKSEKAWPPNLETSPPDQKQFHIFLINDQVIHQGLQTLPKSVENPTYVNFTNAEEADSLSVVPYSRTMCISKLVTITNYVLRFIYCCVESRNRRNQKKSLEYQSKTMQEYKQADMEEDEVKKRKITRSFIIKYHYQDSKDRLQLTIPARLRPKLEEDELYHHTRPFANSRHERHTDAMKSPVIIIHKHPLAQLIVLESHLSLLHQGVKDVISDIQRTYWIEKLRNLVRKIRSECVTCRRMHAKPYAYPYAEFLPSIRSQFVSPFAFVGLDYCGPLRYKSNGEKGKVWILLVTCIVTRGVHLEVVTDNTTYSFIMALKRYFARSGVPQSILSDNSPTFKLGYSIVNRDLKTLINKSLTLTSFLADKQIEIRFITPFSPWQGGIYERIVALVKNMISKTLGKLTVPFIELESLVIEAEGIINSRPITANKVHISDAEPIRPVDFLLPQTKLAVPEPSRQIVEQVKPGETEKLTRRLLESSAAVRENLWNVFSDEYYTLLRESHIRQTAHSKFQPIPGTTVLIVTGKVSRYQWPMGIIQQVLKSKDGKILSVYVKVGTKILEKAVNHLIPLELPVEEIQETTPVTSSATTTQISTTQPTPETPSTQSMDTVHNKRTRPYLHRKTKEKPAVIDRIDEEIDEEVSIGSNDI